MKNLLLKTATVSLVSALAFNAYAENESSNNADNNFYVGALIGNTSLDAGIDYGSDTSSSIYIGMGYAKSFELRAGFLNLGDYKNMAYLLMPALVLLMGYLNTQC